MKTAKFTKTFSGDGSDFSAYHEAVEFLQKNGFSSGSMQREAPIGVMKGDWNIAKWRNLSSEDREALDGMMTFPGGSPRNGEVKVEIYVDFEEKSVA